jgi:hypothetical protein
VKSLPHKCFNKEMTCSLPVLNVNIENFNTTFYKLKKMNKPHSN